jgi:glycosyltransferase involved in cell wall biosynthesis
MMNALFLQSQSFYGADSQQHGLLMRHFDRALVRPHVALTTTPFSIPGQSADRYIREIPDLRVRSTSFGPSLLGIHGMERAKRLSALPIVPINLLSLASYVRRHHIQIIHATEKPRDAFYAAILSKLTGARSVIQVHVKCEDWLSAPVKWSLRQADAIVGVSQYVARTIVESGYPAHRVFGVLNSLDLTDTIWDPTLDGRSVRRELGIANDAPLVGIIARLFSWKGHDALLDALAIVKREVPDVRLIVVGDDDVRAHPGGGSYRAQLEARLPELNLQDSVIFTGFRADIPQVMSALDVFAMPSWEEPFGMVYLEAMAMKKPVVAWASGGAPEIVADHETGFVVPPHSKTELAAALTRLLRDPSLRRQFGEAGRKRVEDRFTPYRMCQDVLAVYQAALGGPASGRLRAFQAA